MSSVIQSDRLDLIPLRPTVRRALLAGKPEEAEELLGITAPRHWDIHGRHLAAQTLVPVLHLWDLQSMRRELRALGLDW